MRIRIASGLLVINLLSVLLAVVISLFPIDILRIILGVPFLLFFPGYVLVLALFPRKGVLSGVERVGLSLGLSIAVVSLLGLGLNYTPWGITVVSALYSVLIFIFVFSVLAWFRQRRLSGAERFCLERRWQMPGWKDGTWGKVLSIALSLAVLAAVGALGYAIAKPVIGERFTEFYILGVEGEAANYPGALVVGETGQVVVGIINHEGETTTYRVEIAIAGIKNHEVAPLVLEDGGVYEEVVDFTPDTAGEKQKVEFWLYKSGEGEPYQELHLWVDVTG